MATNDVTHPDRDFGKLHPLLRLRLLDLFQEVGRRGISVFVTETWRSPDRQAWLYAQGRSEAQLQEAGLLAAVSPRPGPLLTYARPGQSYHNLTIEGVPYSAAADFAIWDEDVPWSKSLDWNGDEREWQILHAAAAKVGLKTLEFEKPHVQLPFALAELRAGEHWPTPWPHPRPAALEIELPELPVPDYLPTELKEIVRA